MRSDFRRRIKRYPPWRATWRNRFAHGQYRGVRMPRCASPKRPYNARFYDWPQPLKPPPKAVSLLPLRLFHAWLMGRLRRVNVTDDARRWWVRERLST